MAGILFGPVLKFTFGGGRGERRVRGYTGCGFSMGGRVAEETFQVRDFWIIVLIALAYLVGSPSVFAQDQSNPPSTPDPAKKPAAQEAPQTHHFWDKENNWLFAGVGASRTLDYFSTLNFRRRGDNEVLLTNDLVDNHAAFAAAEAGATGLSIGVSYLFHRYGHHKLERWVSIIHISAATVGAAHNYSLKTVHKATPAP